MSRDAEMLKQIRQFLGRRTCHEMPPSLQIADTMLRAAIRTLAERRVPGITTAECLDCGLHQGYAALLRHNETPADADTCLYVAINHAPEKESAFWNGRARFIATILDDELLAYMRPPMTTFSTPQT